MLFYYARLHGIANKGGNIPVAMLLGNDVQVVTPNEPRGPGTNLPVSNNYLISDRFAISLVIHEYSRHHELYNR